MSLRINVLKAFPLLLLSVVVELETARILAVYPVPSISHQVVFHPITKELARRGHELVVITPDPAFPNGQAPGNVIEIDLHNASYSYLKERLKEDPTGFEDIAKITELVSEVFDNLLQTDEVKKIISDKDSKFDLLLVEAVVRPAVCFSHLFNVPLIQISSLGATYQTYGIFGAPRHPFLYPANFRRRLYNLSLWEKIIEFYDYLHSDLIYLEENDNKMLKRHFGDDFPILSELYSNIDLVFLNEHPIWSDNRPVPPGIIHIWGIHQKPEKKLPEDLKSYLDSSTRGVIYFSLGSNVKSFMLPPQKVEIMVKVLSELPYNVLWKWDVDKLPGEPKNIKLSKWLPQTDLLRHPNIKLFITQGGLQSTDEGLRAGVPFMGIPYLGDQFYNVEKYDKLKIGKFLYIEDITEESFRGAIEAIIGDKKYKDNVMKLRAVMYDQPQTALERAVWWIEYVLRHGGAQHLRASGANMHWTQYYEIELVAIVAAFICTVLSVLALCLRHIWSRVLRPLRIKLKSS